MLVICDISAWQYWRTPPILGSGLLNADVLDPLLPERSPDRVLLGQLRSNAREADRAVFGRLLGDLKGISLPVHVMVSDTTNMRPNVLTVPHRIPKGLPRNATVDLGGGLSVLSPEHTLALPGGRVHPARIAKRMFEACGIFSLCPSNDRIDAVQKDLVTRGFLTVENYRDLGIYGHSDERGNPLSHFRESGEALSWVPSFLRNGQVTDMWKRPPLTSVEKLSHVVKELKGTEGIREVRHALAMTMDGAASPEEARAAMMLCSGAWNGGEAFGRPDLNRRIPLDAQAAKLAHTSYCIGDMVWPDEMADLEIQGKAYHADDQGFAIVTGRTPALESMGYTVKEITREQLSDLELFDLMLPSLARMLNMEPRHKTVAFLRRREELHRVLFSEPYDPE